MSECTPLSHALATVVEKTWGKINPHNFPFHPFVEKPGVRFHLLRSKSRRLNTLSAEEIEKRDNPISVPILKDQFPLPLATMAYYYYYRSKNDAQTCVTDEISLLIW